MGNDNKQPDPNNNPLSALGLVTTLGFTITTPIVVGVIAGKILHAKFDTGAGVMAACVLGGVFAGLVAGVLSLLREIGWKR